MDAELVESFRVQGVRGQRPYVVGADFELADLIEPLAGIPLAERMATLTPARVMACGDQSGET
ncbi:hypothetical protein [Amycolatopsis sp. 195334CR]|uniref:hypothetical protein n=1 Tax=Amycolatopsis sp. 195334CR TaxID=2814588 RepID=UPI001A8E719F|nr:hypothetical protein [Amycolatopsis sp. 195334CR]MBN6036904.1 hypothetical protein [Amycolatopsis sp. 195334CR]